MSDWIGLRWPMLAFLILKTLFWFYWDFDKWRVNFVWKRGVHTRITDSKNVKLRSCHLLTHHFCMPCTKIPIKTSDIIALTIFFGDNSTNISHLLQDRFDQHKIEKTPPVFFSRSWTCPSNSYSYSSALVQYIDVLLTYLLTYFLISVVWWPKQHCEKRPRRVVRCTCGARTKSITRRGVRNSRRGHKSDMKPTQAERLGDQPISRRVT